MAVVSPVASLAKSAGKKILENLFPGPYKLHEQYKKDQEKKTDRTPENQKTEIQKDFEAIETDIKDTNTLLETELSVMGNQTAILEQILEEISLIRKEMLFGGGGPDLPDIERKKNSRPRGKVRTRPGYKYNEKTQRYHNEKTNRMVSAEEATGVKQEKKPRVRPKPKIGPSVQTEEKVSKSVLQRFVKFLERKGATKLAQKIGVKVAAMAGGAIVPGIGWLFDAVLIASSIYDIYEAYQYWQEFKEEEAAVKPVSYKQPSAQTRNPIPVLPGTVTSGDQKQILTSLSYKVTNNIGFKADEINLKADKMLLSEDFIKLLLNSLKESEQSGPQKADTQDRSRELLDVGARLGGGGNRTPAARGQGGAGAPAEEDQAFLTSHEGGGSGFAGVNAGKLDPAFAAAASKAIKDAEQISGQHIVVSEGYRDSKTQAQYYANYIQQPVTWEGETYTPKKRGGIAAPPGKSKHQRGLAIDVSSQGREALIKTAPKYGITWGGSFGDPPHFQFASGTPYVPETGIATVGELGSETVVGKSGIRKTGSGAHPMMLRKGESVIPAGEKRSSSEIMAEYQNAKAFADGTPQVRPLLSPGETTQPIQPIKIETPAEMKMKKYLEGVPYDPVLQAGMKKIGGSQNIIMKEDLLTRSNLFGVYIPPDVKGKNGASEKTLSAFRNKIYIDPRGGGQEQIKTTVQHELSHAATQEYWEKNLISPEMTSEIKGFTGKSPKDAGLYGNGLGEEARQRIRDLETRGQFMDGDELEGVSAYVNKYKPYDEKGLTPNQIDEYEASRDKMLSNLNKDVEKAFSSVQLLGMNGGYK